MTKQQPSKEALKTLEALKKAVEKELEKKRRLGHYAVMVDSNGKIYFHGGEDAPASVEAALREIGQGR